MKAEEVVKILKDAGAEWRQGKGSHRVYSFGECTTVVPMHSGDMPKGTLRAIERQMEPCLGRKWLTQ
jgi:predicted RNA binding protein YcfA (HicA-like mRNA interferase family)